MYPKQQAIQKISSDAQAQAATVEEISASIEVGSSLIMSIKIGIIREEELRTDFIDLYRKMIL